MGPILYLEINLLLFHSDFIFRAHASYRPYQAGRCQWSSMESSIKDVVRRTLSSVDIGSRQELEELKTKVNTLQKRVKLLEDIWDAAESTYRQELERDRLDLMDYHLTASLKELRLDRLILDIMEIIRKYHLRIPPSHFITLKSLITAEGTARLLYPQLDVVGEMEPHVRRLAALRFKPEVIWRHLRALIFEIVASPTKLPR
jgi:predicted unusual protein kinase regulating ubiquinone biosynthesis (AarF/ABC1/UbiB family)